jgi:hypothetical protein
MKEVIPAYCGVSRTINFMPPTHSNHSGLFDEISLSG